MAKTKEVKKKKPVSKKSVPIITVPESFQKKEIVITKLERILFENKISIEKLSMESNISRDLLSKFKNGHKDPDSMLIGTIKSIVNALNSLTGKQFKFEDLI